MTVLADPSWAQVAPLLVDDQGVWCMVGRRAGFVRVGCEWWYARREPFQPMFAVSNPATLAELDVWEDAHQADIALFHIPPAPEASREVRSLVLRAPGRCL